MRVALLLAAVGALGACRGSDGASATPDPGTASSTVTAAAAIAASGKHHGAADGAHPEHEVVECPAVLAEGLEDEERIAALLEEANRLIERGVYGAAWTCADRAADINPASVEAHHLRGASLAALGRDRDAQLAYSMAIALDPDDPETLRAVADFYINGRGERGRDTLWLGLELAQRGSRRAQARRLRNPPLAADLAVLEAQALNDLGRSDEALARIEAALRIAPDRGDALHERGVALFDLSRFAEAQVALQRALEVQPEDAFTHQMFGLTLEQLGDERGAEASLARARQLAPGELAAPILIPVAEFRQEIAAIVASLPPERRALVEAVTIEIADLPAPEDLAARTPPFPPTILGLYRGPVGPAAKLPPVAGEEPRSIVLYRKNLARAVKTREELSEQIRETLLHEIGHVEGLDEDDLRRRGME